MSIGTDRSVRRDQVLFILAVLLTVAGAAAAVAAGPATSPPLRSCTAAVVGDRGGVDGPSRLPATGGSAPQRRRTEPRRLHRSPPRPTRSSAVATAAEPGALEHASAPPRTPSRPGEGTGDPASRSPTPSGSTPSRSSTASPTPCWSPTPSTSWCSPTSRPPRTFDFDLRAVAPLARSQQVLSDAKVIELIREMRQATGQAGRRMVEHEVDDAEGNRTFKITLRSVPPTRPTSRPSASSPSCTT